MAMGGCREGEVFGLKWDDIQWKDSQIFIKRTFLIMVDFTNQKASALSEELMFPKNFSLN